jgi:hypothetical protein
VHRIKPLETNLPSFGDCRESFGFGMHQADLTEACWIDAFAALFDRIQKQSVQRYFWEQEVLPIVREQKTTHDSLRRWLLASCPSLYHMLTVLFVLNR